MYIITVWRLEITLLVRPEHNNGDGQITHAGT